MGERGEMGIATKAFSPFIPFNPVSFIINTTNLAETPPPNQQNVNIKVEDAVLKGAYSNMMFASHTKEEFIMDFMSVFGRQGVQVAKIITSPGHFKRIVAALTDNLKKYEKQFGEVKSEMKKTEQSTSESSHFGF